MKVKSVLFLLLFTLFYTNAFSQKKITWKELSTVYRNEIFPKEGGDKKTTFEYQPNISNDKKTLSLKDIEGKKITVRGYFLDLGADSMWYMLSRFPFENCFFCTGVGPETVIELVGYQNDKTKFETDDIITVTGNLYLVKDYGEYIYVLENCAAKPSGS